MTPLAWLAAFLFISGLLGIPVSWYLYWYYDVIDLPQFHMLSGAFCGWLFCGIACGLMALFKWH